MFGLFKSKELKIVSPVSGEVVALESVSDEVFSQKMVGDGLAILPADGTFGAPVDGTVSKLYATHHAYIVRHKSGVEVMVHIGLDTVALKGKGFEPSVKEGDEVRAGDTIVRADLDLIGSLGKEIVTPVIVTEMNGFKTIEKRSGSLARGDTMMELK